MENEQIQVLNCSSCGAQLKIDSFQETVICEYCDSSFSVAELLNESEALRIEKSKNLAYIEIEKSKRKVESEYLKHKIEQEKISEQKEIIANFKKSKLSKALIVLTFVGFLFCMVSFGNGQILAGIIAIAIIVFSALSWFMGMQTIKEKKNGIRLICTIIAFVLIVPYFHVYNISSTDSVKDTAVNIEWSDLQLGKIIPEPIFTLGKIGVDLDNSLSVTLYDIDDEGYKNYVVECQDYGFTIEPEKSPTTYVAFNNEGYKVRLIKSSDIFSIHLDAPENMTEFEWPEYGLAPMLPKTKSNIGRVSLENSETFIVHVGNMNINDFNEYIKECQNIGFTIDHSKSEKHYNAFNKKGYELSLRYLGFNKIEISLKNANN